MHFNALVPELAVSDFATSLHFYTHILGFTVEYQREEDGFAFLSFQGSQLMIDQGPSRWTTGPLEHPYGRGINFEIHVDSLDVVLTTLAAQQYPLFREPEERWYRQGQSYVGNYQFLVLDPDGYQLRFAQSLGKKDA